MSETKEKRTFWQFHLSTAVVLMLASGLILWANTKTTIVLEIGPSERGAEWEKFRQSFASGWPVAVRTICYEYGDSLKTYSHRNFDLTATAPNSTGFIPYAPMDGRAIFIDAFAALFVLSLLAFVSEFLIRRREARKAEASCHG